MIAVHLRDGVDFAEWRSKARELLHASIAPEHVNWNVGEEQSLFGAADTPLPPASESARLPNVPRDFLAFADTVLAHSDPQRHALLYRLLWRLTHGEPTLLARITDDDVARAKAHEKAVRRDSHKMHAFVRFRELAQGEGEAPVYVAWFEPEHYILERNTGFFVRRFAGMRWSILTPYRSAHWDGETLRLGPGATRDQAPQDDALEDLWRDYYASIFNPARLKVQAMKSEMPVKYWKNLPEAQLIPGLIREAMPRAQEMIAKDATIARKRVAAPSRTVAELLQGGLAQLRQQAHDCRRCELWKPATQTVFGIGPEDARIVLLGEQPGDQEDLAGKPFIGPAGKLLDRALQEIGLDRQQLYVTNTVKHFKFEARGKFRLHKRADSREQAACRPWLDAELARLQPQAIVCLGSMAASAIFGSSFKLLQERGHWRDLGEGRRAFATVHPSYLLRLPDENARQQGYADFVRDLSLLKQLAA